MTPDLAAAVARIDRDMAQAKAGLAIVRRSDWTLIRGYLSDVLDRPAETGVPSPACATTPSTPDS